MRVVVPVVVVVVGVVIVVTVVVVGATVVTAVMENNIQDLSTIHKNTIIIRL